MQPQDTQPGIPFDQFVIKEPVRARRLELEPSGALGQPRYGAPASDRSRELQFGSERNGFPDQRAAPQRSDASAWSTPQQPGQEGDRDPSRRSTNGGPGLPRRARSAGRATPDQAGPAAPGAAAGARDAVQSEAEAVQKADRLAQIRRELPDWRQERDAPLYNTPTKEYRLRRH